LIPWSCFHHLINVSLYTADLSKLWLAIGARVL
jgi:hypothetical protein